MRVAPLSDQNRPSVMSLEAPPHPFPPSAARDMTYERFVVDVYFFSSFFSPPPKIICWFSLFLVFQFQFLFF
jgi:hypothetical protein